VPAGWEAGQLGVRGRLASWAASHRAGRVSGGRRRPRAGHLSAGRHGRSSVRVARPLRRVGHTCRRGPRTGGDTWGAHVLVGPSGCGKSTQGRPPGGAPLANQPQPAQTWWPPPRGAGGGRDRLGPAAGRRPPDLDTRHR